MPGAELLLRVGARVRSERERRGWSRRQLSERSGLSERFLAQLETGEGNISLVRFAEVAEALGATPAELLAGPGAAPRLAIALLGVRGAGKSTVGKALARRLRVRFVEVDQRIERAAGISLGEIFELHGEPYYRRLERDVLTRLLAAGEPTVIATGGSIVNDAANFSLLRSRARTVWLKATADDHWTRVVAQGDRRPMADSPHAFAELRALIAARAGAYRQADLTVDTSPLAVDEVVHRVLELTANR